MQRIRKNCSYFWPTYSDDFSSWKKAGQEQAATYRSHQTVEAILHAVIRILKREGFEAITTNRIAEVAGVSIGSVYQYFPDKRAIFVALHQRHIEQIDGLWKPK
jgi:AcrR family transcriptional regulator